MGLRRFAILALSALAAAACAEAAFAPRDEVTAAEEAMADWTAQNPTGWSAASATVDPPTRPEWTHSCSDSTSNGYVSLQLRTRRGEVELAFRCPLDEHATAADLQEAFVRATPWNLPTGITRPNWRFSAALPLNSIFDGVTFAEPQPGVLEVELRTTMRGVRAESLRDGCESAMTVPRLGCILERPHRVPLQMRFLVANDLSALR